MRLLPLPGVFRPPSDSWMLVKHIESEPLRSDARVLDLCTGSGVLAIAAACRKPMPSVTAVDVSRRAVLAARLNARLNGVRVRTRRGDLFAPVATERFDLIVSNPPYVPTVDGPIPSRGLARAWEGGPDGRTLIDRICQQAAAHLRPGGVLMLVHSSICGEDATLGALSCAGLDASMLSRHPGPLGPLMRARASALRERGFLDGDREEVLVIAGRLGVAVGATRS